jgi:tetratricopeptide (TPR) repeat protein
LKQVVLKGAEIRPVILAIEDLHWADRSTEDALKVLLESIPGSRILLVFTYRPQFVHIWGGKSYHNQITLNRLSNRESLTMAASLLGGGEIDRDIEDLILSKTEGVPFFIEEFIKSLKDLKIIEKEKTKYTLAKDMQAVKVPSTIHDIIMARVDALPQNAKELLQIGSVIEREFSYELIKKVTNFPDSELFAGFSTLKDSELLYERGIFPQSTYVFKHALTREVVYDSILARRKKELHGEIGKGVEELYSRNLNSHYGVLAEHFFLSENYSKAAEYSRMAGKNAEKAASFPDAIAYSQKRIVCLEKMPRAEADPKKIIDARTAYALYLAQLNHFYEAGQAILPIVDLATRHDYRRRLGQIKIILGTYHYIIEEDYPKAYQAFEDALKISGEMNDLVTSIFANFWFGCALGFDCEFDRSELHLQRAVDINVLAKNSWGIAAMKANLALSSYFFSGRVHKGFPISHEAVLLAEECSDIYSKGMTYSIHGSLCLAKGLIDEAINFALKGAELCEKISLYSYAMMAHTMLGEAYFEKGDFDKSGDHFEKACLLMENNRQFPSWLSGSRLGLIRSKVLNGERDVEIDSLFSYSKKNRLKSAEAWIAIYLGEILMNLDDRHIFQAEDWIQKAIQKGQKNGTKYHLGKAYALYGEFSRRKGDRLKSQENLGKAIEILKECGADVWVEKYEKELALIQARAQ